MLETLLFLSWHSTQLTDFETSKKPAKLLLKLARKRPNCFQPVKLFSNKLLRISGMLSGLDQVRVVPSKFRQKPPKLRHDRNYVRNRVDVVLKNNSLLKKSILNQLSCVQDQLTCFKY